MSSRLAPRVALETTLILHGVPRHAALPLAGELRSIVGEEGAEPAIVGLFNGHARPDLSESELEQMLDLDECPKANTSNLGLHLAGGTSAATTVSATMEIAAGAGIRIFATGGLGGVHRGMARHLDVSADLAAFTRFPVGVVTSGVKSLLDVAATREVLEMLGVPVVGFQTSEFPAFYLQGDPAGPIPIDARFDDIGLLARFVGLELERTGRGIVIANPIPDSAALDAGTLGNWMEEAQERSLDEGATGRAVTPSVLGHLHEVSNGATLEANLELVRSNARLAARLATAIASRD